MAKHYKGSIGASMGGKVYKRPKIKLKGKKVYCKDCSYLAFGYYCNKKSKIAKWVDKPKVCKSFNKKQHITNQVNDKNKIYDENIRKKLLCSNCGEVYIHFKGNHIKCSLTDTKRTITSVKKARNRNVRIPKWCPKK